MELDDPFANASDHTKTEEESSKTATLRRSQTLAPATPISGKAKWGKLTSDKIRRSLSVSDRQPSNKQIGELKVKPTSIPMGDFSSWEDGIKAVCRQQQQQNRHSPKMTNLSPKNGSGRPGLMSKTMSMRSMGIMNTNNGAQPGNGRPGMLNNSAQPGNGRPGMKSKTMSMRAMNGRPGMMNKTVSLRTMNVSGLLRQKSYAGLGLEEPG